MNNKAVETIGVTPVECLFVGNLSIICAKSDLELLFAPFGLVKAEIRYDSKFVPFGFVTFQSIDHARAAMETRQCNQVHGRKFKYLNNVFEARAIVKLYHIDFV